jgi:hypothetical protein
MTKQEYRKALDAALEELEAQLQMQEDTAARILSLRRTVTALSTLCEEEGGEPIDRKQMSQSMREALEGSITEDILNVVYTSKRLMTTTDILNELEKIGTLESHKNPLATINAVLNRLQEQGKVRCVNAQGKKMWTKKSVLLVSKSISNQ